MSTPPSPWTPKASASRRWSAKCDKLCPAPRSDDYNDWNLMQLKREITQRQLKTNPRRRNKEAFVGVLLQDDAAGDGQNQPPTLEEQVVLTPRSKTHLESTPVVVNLATQSPIRTCTSPVATSFAAELEASYRPPKKQRKSEMIDHFAGEKSGGASAQVPSGKQVDEFSKSKLSIETARLQIESRRLDLETNREERDSELHVVQLALAQEQLQQAKLTTQKMRSEWMVEQLLQKKRLRDAGISQEESANMGLF